MTVGKTGEDGGSTDDDGWTSKVKRSSVWTHNTDLARVRTVPGENKLDLQDFVPPAH